MTNKLSGLWKAMIRTKKMEQDNMETRLNRCLTAFDLTLLGIGNMAGSGIYVLTGTVIRDKAGPAVFLSFLIAGITAFLNALCYAELGSRIPKAGSAYSYTYIASGEFLAFIIGWSVVLEYVLSVSSVARGWSGTLDSLLGGAISNGTKNIFFSNFTPPSWMGEYPDIVALCIVVLLGLILASGPKMSANFNSIITSINIVVIFFTTGIMITHPYNGGKDFAKESTGGFMPFHFAGVLAGAGTCFYSFIGFDAITVSSEEASNPKKEIPKATGISVGFVTFLFVIASLSLVLFVPWDKVDRRAAFTAALNFRNMHWASYITGVGSLLGISASLFTSMYAMPRVVYAMANDGLLPQPLAHVHGKTQTPLVSLIIFGVLAALLALIFSIDTLADFLSIGTLIAYTIVCVNVCILRYRNAELYEDQSAFPAPIQQPTDGVPYENLQDDKSQTSEFVPAALPGRLKNYFQNFPILRDASPGHAPIYALVMMVVFSVSLCCLILLGSGHLEKGEIWAIVLLVISILGLVVSLCVMVMHQQNKEFDSFKVPFVPVVPCLCIILNITLIVKLSPYTWLRFAVWTGLGLILYFGYGTWHSNENFGKDEGGPLLSYKSTEEPRMEESSEYPQYPQHLTDDSPINSSQ